MSIKQERVAERIRVILSELLMREVADPRLQSITVTSVKVDPEIMFARVYVNALGDESREKEVMQGLKSAMGFLRRELSKRLRLRTTPELRFIWDKALDQGDRVERLLDSLEIPESEPEPETESVLDMPDDDDYDGYGDEDWGTEKDD